MYNYLLRVLSQKYDVKDLGEASQVLGWTITRNKNNSTIHIRRA